MYIITLYFIIYLITFYISKWAFDVRLFYMKDIEIYWVDLDCNWNASWKLDCTIKVTLKKYKKKDNLV